MYSIYIYICIFWFWFHNITDFIFHLLYFFFLYKNYFKCNILHFIATRYLIKDYLIFYLINHHRIRCHKNPNDLLFAIIYNFIFYYWKLNVYFVQNIFFNLGYIFNYTNMKVYFENKVKLIICSFISLFIKCWIHF